MSHVTNIEAFLEKIETQSAAKRDAYPFLFSIKPNSSVIVLYSYLHTTTLFLFMKSISFLYCFCFACIALASDEQRENKYATEIKKNLQLGSAIYLNSDNGEFLALYTETETIKNKGTVILLHDQGQHPDQKNLIHDLRTILPKHNWATLSLQMPLWEFGAKTEDYYALIPKAMQRIQTSIEYLQKSNIKNIVLVGYGIGSLMALYFINETRTTAVKALVTISLPVPETDIQAAQTLIFLKNVNAPLLDIYGAKDIQSVSNSARKKRIAARENLNFRQVKVNQVGRSFQNHEDLLIKRVYSWLGFIFSNR
jgi:triacylglycerol esterase/lipase EstA (alpha/beta hydrolase family)